MLKINHQKSKFEHNIARDGTKISAHSVLDISPVFMFQSFSFTFFSIYKNNVLFPKISPLAAFETDRQNLQPLRMKKGPFNTLAIKNLEIYLNSYNKVLLKCTL